MGTAYTPDALRGIFIRDPRITPGKTGAGSSYTQAVPQPGVPEPVSPSMLTLSTSGEQVNGTTIEVQTTRAGGAVTTDAIRAGGFAWREAGGAWQGRDGPLGYAGFNTVHGWASGGGAELYSYPHVLYTSAGTRLVTTQKTTGVGVLQTLRVHRFTQAGAMTFVDVVSSLASGQPLYSCLVALPESRLLLLAYYDDLPSAGAQVRAYMSVDDGVSWSLQATACLPAYVDTATVTARRLRACYYGGQVLMILAMRVPAATVPDTLWQYASVDDGVSFALVQAVPGTSATSTHTGGAHDIVAIPDVGFGVVYCGSSRTNYGANSATLAKRLGSAYSRWTDIDPVAVGLVAPATTLSAGNLLSDDTELCASVNDDGQIYAFSPNATDNNNVIPARSSDGLTWITLGLSSGMNWRTSLAFATERTSSMTCAWYAGALHLVHSVDSTTIYDAQLADTVLAGYTAATLPMLPAVQDGSDYSAGSYMTWEPYWEPTTIGWTATTVGAPTTTLTGGAMQISAGFGEVRTYTHARAFPTGAGHTVQCLWEVDTDSGNATETTLTAHIATSSYRLRVRVTTTTVVVFDDVSGATLVSYARTAGQFVHIRAFASNAGATGRCTVWVDELDGPSAITRGYVRIVDTTLTDGGATAAAQSVKFGQSGVGVSNWRYVAWQSSTSMSSPHQLVLPGDLNGVDFSTRSLTLSQGLRLRAVGGPAVLGDSWNIAARYGHGIDALDLPSPSVRWRSVDSLSAQVMVWETSTTVASVSPAMGSMGAMYIGGANFRTATLEGRNAAGAYVAIGTWDASSGQTGLSWNRRGNVVYPSIVNASSGVYFYPHAMMDSGRFTFDLAAGPVRTIQYQTEGAWTALDTKKARLAVYGDVSAVGATGTTGALMSPGGLLVWNNDPQYSAFRLTIPVQPVAEAHYEMGVCLIGHLAVFGRRYSWGRALQTQPNTELRTGSSGRRTAQVAGPSRRSVEFGWSDASDQSELGLDMTTTQPDYVVGVSSGAPTPTPVAAAKDGPGLIRGIVDHLNGSAEPVVYVAYLPRVALGTAQMVVHDDLHLYGRIVSDVSIETVQGKEWDGKGNTGEMVRTSSIRLEEEL
jgi:hypothetical protein